MTRLQLTILMALLVIGFIAPGCIDRQSPDNHALNPRSSESDHSGHDHAVDADDHHPGEPGEQDDLHEEHEDEHTDADLHAEQDEHLHDDETADPHAGHDHEGEGDTGIELDAHRIEELGIVTAPAGAGELDRIIELNGEMAVNEDEVIHITPRISGIIRNVHFNLGDHVRAGDPMLELDSIELAEVSGEYLAVLSRIELAAKTADREEMLLSKGISAEQDYLEARQALEEEQINARSIRQKLTAMGLGDRQISRLEEGIDLDLTTFTVFAPVSGEIIEKHASVGEMVSTESAVYTISEMKSVWVRLNVYQQDIPDVSEGMEVMVDAGHGAETVTGIIDYIEPLIGSTTRTAVARVILPMTSEVFRPGLFVTAGIMVPGDHAEIVVPESALVDVDQDKMVFVREGNQYHPRVVELGRSVSGIAEILSGIESGAEVVIQGAFQLKAELLKGTFDPHAGHAH